MADVDDPEIPSVDELLSGEVKAYQVLSFNSQDKVDIFLGPQIAVVSVAKWPKDEVGKVTDIGKTLSIVIPRHALIGLAHEILKTY